MQIFNIKMKLLYSAFFLSICCLAVPLKANAEQKPHGESHSVNDKTANQESDSEFKKWKEYAAPGENHKVLDQFVGTWDFTVKQWSSPGSEPALSKGTSKIEWIMGGRFLQETAIGTSMGQPFEGMGIDGYDNARKEYVSIWIDNRGTGIMVSSGKYDASTKTFEEKGEFVQPKMGETPFRGIIRDISDDNFIYEIYTKDKDWQEYKALEIDYKRKK